MYLLCQWANTGGAPPCPLPTAPVDLGATSEIGYVLLQWPAGVGATGYNIKRSLVPGGPYTVIGTAMANPFVAYTDSTGSFGTTYYYVLSSTNACGESVGNSIESHAIPQWPTPSNTVLPVITGTVQDSFTLSGSNGTWTNATGYTYQWYANGFAIGGATANTFLLTSAQVGQVITLKVTASNAGGNGTPATSAATNAVTRPLHALAVAWAAQVVTNGGAAPSGATVTTISDFCYALDAGSLTSKFLSLNCFVPGDLPTAFTPLIHNKGSDPWANNPGDTAFQVGDLTVNGLIGDGTKCLLTSIVGTDFASTSSYGVTIYSYTGTAGNPQREIGFTDGAQTNALGAWVNETPFSLAILGSANGVVGDYTHGAGYYSANRVSTTDARYFYASSISPHALIGAIDAVLNTTALGNYQLYVFGQYRWDQGPNGYGLTHNRLSFAAIHSGLTPSDSAILFTAVQAMRTSLGGGYL